MEFNETPLLAWAARHRYRYRECLEGKEIKAGQPRESYGEIISCSGAVKRTTIRYVTFDFTAVIHYPHDVDISYEHSNNYTVRSRPESLAVSGRQKTILLSGAPSLATRWQPSFLVTVCPIKSTVAGIAGHLDAERCPSEIKLDSLAPYLYVHILFFE